MEPQVGVEPTAFSLQISCTTIVLLRRSLASGSVSHTMTSMRSDALPWENYHTRAMGIFACVTPECGSLANRMHRR